MRPSTEFSENALSTCRWLAIITAIAAPISTAVTSVASVALLIAWLASGEMLNSLKISFQQPAGKMLLVFFAWLIIGTLYADTSWHDKGVTLLSWKKLLYTFVLLGLFYEERWKRLFIRNFLNVMTLAVIVSSVLWIAKLPPIPRRELGIVMTSHSSQSMAFIAAIVCCIFLLKESRTAQTRYLLISAILLFLYNILFISTARSGYMALPVAVVVAVACLYGYKKLPYIIGIVATMLILAILTSTTLQQGVKKGWDEKMNYKTSTELTSVGLRVVFLQNTIELIEKSPVFGYGTSSFKSTYSPHAAEKYTDWRGGPTSDPHNQYLFIWLENGLIGVMLFLSYIAVALYQGVRYQPYGGMAASFLLAICATSLFNSHFKTFPEGFLLAFFVGILLARYEAVTNRDSIV